MPSINKRLPFIVFSFAILLLFMSLRYDYGNDYMEYMNIHYLINLDLPAWGSEDILFKYLNKSIPNFFFMIFFISIFYILVIYELITKNLNSNQYWLAVFILLVNPYLYLIHLSSIRQTLAICFFIIAVNFAIKRKILPYIFFVILASGMHASATILLPVYFLITEKINKKIQLITLSMLFLLLFTPLFDSITNILMQYYPSHYEFYYNEQSGNSLRATLLSSIFFFVVFFNLNKLEQKEIVYAKLSLIGTIFSMLAFKLSMVTRFSMYFEVFLIITIPQILNKIPNKILRYTILILLLLIYVLRYYSFFNNPLWEKFWEYKSLFNR